MISEESKARFAKEVAKYPADQKQSAVMACLTIVQQELGYVSAESEQLVAEYLGMAPMATGLPPTSCRACLSGCFRCHGWPGWLMPAIRSVARCCRRKNRT